jgi:hypothetical protein
MCVEQASLLQGSSLPVRALGDVEDDCMGMELRRGIAIDGAGGVVLELRGNELPGDFGRVVAADASLCIAFQLRQRTRDGLAVCLSYPFVPANKGGQRNGLWGGERRIPAGTMLDRPDSFVVRVLVLVRLPMLYKLIASQRMLSFGQPSKLLRSDRAGQSELLRELPLPFSGNFLAPSPIALIG